MYNFVGNNITKTYQKSTNSKVSRVDLDAKKIADKLLISESWSKTRCIYNGWRSQRKLST